MGTGGTITGGGNCAAAPVTDNVKAAQSSKHGSDVYATCIAAILVLTHACKVLLAVRSPGKSVPEHRSPRDC
jgi:hypothetical protein